MGVAWGLLAEFCNQNEMEEWLTQSLCIDDIRRRIDKLLALLGRKLECETLRVFEYAGKDSISNTHEWNQDEISPKKERLKRVQLSGMKWCQDKLHALQPVIVDDVEKYKDIDPRIYSMLKPQDIKSRISIPLHVNGEHLGILNAYNMPQERIDEIVDSLTGIGGLISNLIKSCYELEKMRYASYHDHLTGALNSYALEERCNSNSKYKRIGILYCNISTIKYAGNSLGHEDNDNVAKEYYKILHGIFNPHHIYHIRSDEFVVICSEIPRAEFDSLLALFSEQAKLSDGTIDIGSYWCENGDSSLNALILLAKEEMHQNKSYRNHSGEESNAKNIDNIKCSCTFASATQGINGTIKKYLSENYFDLERFLKSTSLASYYPFFGDMQTGVFYISDPIKEAFGFSKNIIKDLISKWERIITRREDLELYRNDLQDIIKNKRETHDIRYRIKDIHGREFWIRCCGIIQWDAEFEKPLFFSGGISKVDFEFIIDPATNFQREHGAMLEIQELQKHKEAVSFIGFKLNGFKEINDLNGRTVANSILKNIADNLLAIFDGKMQFFRLDGLKFMAIPSADYKEDVQYIIHTIKREIEKVYKEHKIIIKNPCSLCVVNEGWIDSLPSAVISDVLGLLDFAKDHPAEEYALHSLENIKAQRNKSRMIVELNDAVLHDFMDFRIVIQPIVSAKDFKIVGGEVLLRWKYNDKDISPMTFVPILERNQQIIAVGRWVAEQTIVNCRRAMSYMPNFRLNFNVSYHQISDIGFLYFVDECMKQWELKSSHIVMEITETNQNENPKMLQEFIHSCKDMGINVALDDFGTGYSSLELLLRYPSDIIKIDRVLMREMAVSKDTSDFIAGIVHSCHKFGKSVCVEGVESDHELATVIEAQCDTIQGYYFYKPMELPDFYGLLAEQSRG